MSALSSRYIDLLSLIMILCTKTKLGAVFMCRDARCEIDEAGSKRGDIFGWATMKSELSNARAYPTRFVRTEADVMEPLTLAQAPFIAHVDDVHIGIAYLI